MAITNMIWDWNKLITHAPDSDLWPVTQLSNGHLLTGWGDGAGFGNSPSEYIFDHKVPLGFARLEGNDPTNLTYINVYGHPDNSENSIQAPFAAYDNNGKLINNGYGKPGAMIAVDNKVYCFITMQNASDGIWTQGVHEEITLCYSDDDGATWNVSDPRVTFIKWQTIFPADFVNYGANYAGSRDDYIYIHMSEWDKQYPSSWTNLYLARVHRNDILDKTKYTIYTGKDGNNTPIWSSDFNNKRSILIDQLGIGATSCTFNPGLQKYLLTAHGGDNMTTWNLYEADEPWGPWTVSKRYNNDWGIPGNTQVVSAGMYHPMPQKFFSSDGKTGWMFFSGATNRDLANSVDWDRFNMAEFQLVTGDSGFVRANITTQPSNEKTISVGGSISVSIVAGGTSPIYYQWYEDVSISETIAAPTNLVAMITNDNKIKLEWKDNSNNEEYWEIVRNGAPEYAEISSTTGQQTGGTISYIDDNVQPGIEYSYIVAAGKVGMKSGFSNQVTLTLVDGDYIILTTNSIELANTVNSTKTIQLSSNVSWQVVDMPSWLDISPSSGTGNATLTLTTLELNNNENSRRYDITIRRV